MELFSDVVIENNRYKFILNEDLRDIFPEDFWFEYSELPGILPEWVAQIPLLANVAPVIWLMGFEVRISICEKTFWEALCSLKKVFEGLYPGVHWCGKIVCSNIFEAPKPSEKHGSALLFSGGLDSVTTLVKHHEEKPSLLCVNGADVSLNDVERWKTLHDNTCNVAKQFDSQAVFVTSNFRSFLNRNLLKDKIKSFSKKDWWVGFQHGWGLCGFLVPLLWNKNDAIGYIASSDSLEDLSLIGSRPDIDECLKWNNGKIIHDGVEYRRPDKVAYLCKQRLLGINIPEVKVCLRSFAAGQNCCMCEKCARTIGTILTIGSNQPELFGFHDYKKMGKSWLPVFKRNLKKNRFLFDTDWDLIQKEMKPLDWYRAQGLKDYQLEFVEWIAKADFDALREAKESKKSSRHLTPIWIKEFGKRINMRKPLFLRVLWNRFKDRYL